MKTAISIISVLVFTLCATAFAYSVREEVDSLNDQAAYKAEAASHNDTVTYTDRSGNSETYSTSL